MSSRSIRRVRWLVLTAALAWMAGTASAAEMRTFDFNTAPSTIFWNCGGDTCSGPGWEVLDSSVSHSFPMTWDSDHWNLYLYKDVPGDENGDVLFHGATVQSFTVKITRPATASAVSIRPMLDSSACSGSVWGDYVYPAPGTTTISVSGACPHYTGFKVYVTYTDTTTFVTADDLVVTVAGSGPNPDDQHPRDVPVGVGANQPMLQLNYMTYTATNVVAAGTVSADFCIAKDPRERFVAGGWAYQSRVLQIKELKGTGTCKGPLPTPAVVNGVTYTTWEQLLSATRSTIAPWFRTFWGKPRAGKFGGDLTVESVEGFWLLIGNVSSTAQFNGPLIVRPIPENLIDYDSTHLYAKPPRVPDQFDYVKQVLKCNAVPDWRPIELTGTVAAFGDPMNVEGELLIPATGQCDGQTSMVRRSFHAFPLRLDGFFLDEAVNLTQQFAGLSATLTQARGCVNAAYKPVLLQMINSVTAAGVDVLVRRWNSARLKLEDVARKAQNNAGDFVGCPGSANYKGAVMSRSITLAFTVVDRLQYANPAVWQIYYPPLDLDLPDFDY